MNILREQHKAQGWHYLCSDGPDTSGMNRAAEAQAGLSKDQLDWAKQIYAESAPDRADARARATQVSDAQLRAMNTQTDLADEYAAYNRETFRPLEKSIVADAAGYDTGERRNTAANEAMAGIETSLAGQRASTMRDQERTGVNPNSGRIAAMQGSMDLGAAKLKAGAASAARTQVETIGHARTMDAANLGRGLASNQATSAGIAVSQGNSSVANQASTGAITGQGAALMNTGFSGAQSGMAGSANTYGQIYNAQNQANQANGGLWGALGSVGGAALSNGPALMAMSDQNLKEGITPTDPDAALEAVEKTPVSNWAYKLGSMADDGQQQHTGPMAQDVQKNMGERIAPGGKKIDLIAMNGITMSALQGLSRKVDRIAASAGLPA